MDRISIGKEITSLARKLRLLRGQCMKKSGCMISAAHFHVFTFFANHEGSTEKQAVKEIGMDKTLVARAVKKLAAQGLFEVRRDERDARFKRVYPTQMGLEELHKVKAALASIIDVLSLGLSDTQINTFLETLNVMQHNVWERLK